MLPLCLLGITLLDGALHPLLAQQESRIVSDGGCCRRIHHGLADELNVPRALVTEKAFPENEFVFSAAANATGAPGWTTDIIHEQAFAERNELEIDLPVNYAVQGRQHTRGVGDLAIAFKRELFSSLRTGSIFSLQGGVLLPTGSSSLGFGAGTATFEPFAAYDQLIGSTTFVQFQLGGNITVDGSKAPRSLYFRTALGHSMAPDHLLGRLSSPMIEILGSRDYSSGADTEMDVLPEMQLALSRSRHISANIGVREPFTNTESRHPQVVFYVLWDWAEGRSSEE